MAAPSPSLHELWREYRAAVTNGGLKRLGYHDNISTRTVNKLRTIAKKGWRYNEELHAEANYLADQFRHLRRPDAVFTSSRMTRTWGQCHPMYGSKKYRYYRRKLRASRYTSFRKDGYLVLLISEDFLDRYGPGHRLVLLLHELCHTHGKNHGKRFQSATERCGIGRHSGTGFSKSIGDALKNGGEER